MNFLYVGEDYNIYTLFEKGSQKKTFHLTTVARLGSEAKKKGQMLVFLMSIDRI